MDETKKFSTHFTSLYLTWLVRSYMSPLLFLFSPYCFIWLKPCSSFLCFSSSLLKTCLSWRPSLLLFKSSSLSVIPLAADVGHYFTLTCWCSKMQDWWRSGLAEYCWLHDCDRFINQPRYWNRVRQINASNHRCFQLRNKSSEQEPQF